jgi:hypothetical protein
LIETKKFKGYILEAYENVPKEGGYASIKLIKNNGQNNTMGKFKLIEIRKNIYAIESCNWPGFFFEAYDSNINHAKLRLRLFKDDPANIGNDPWGWFKRIEIQIGVFAFESCKYPGFHFDAQSTNGAHDDIRLVKAEPHDCSSDPWACFELKPFPKESITGESKSYFEY